MGMTRAFTRSIKHGGKIPRKTHEWLQTISRSFVWQISEEGCPERSAVARAYFDMLHDLLNKDHAGEWLAFGSSAKFYALGKTGQEAAENLIQKYPKQKAIIWGKIELTDVTSDRAVRYFLWEEAKAKAALALSIENRCG